MWRRSDLIAASQGSINYRAPLSGITAPFGRVDKCFSGASPQQLPAVCRLRSVPLSRPVQVVTWAFWDETR